MKTISAPPLEPAIALPADTVLPGLPSLFDGDWVWQQFCTRFGTPDATPKRVRIQQLSYQPGRRALVSYLVEQSDTQWVVDDQFAIELTPGKPERLFRYPDDPFLPGLAIAASPIEAHKLLAKHFPISPHRIRVVPVRYRPGTRAVLRHVVSWGPSRKTQITWFARVMPPARLPRLLTAAALADLSGFSLPPVVGSWPEGGVVWMSEVPGETLRERIRSGTPPEPERILDALAPLWAAPLKAAQGRPLDVLGGYKSTERLLAHVLGDEEAVQQPFLRVTDVLGPFAKAWRPSTLAHNDFHDDQVLITPADRLALVDFEEVGAGDAQFDVANLLAHLHWMARFGNAPEACEAYRAGIRSAALERFGWDARDLDVREAYGIFRLTSNPVRQMRRDWASRVESGLSLAAEVLGRAN